MKTLLAAGLIALVAAIADASYVLGYNHGDSAARTDLADSINVCYATTQSHDSLYGCFISK